ncbi:MAG: Arm DNA-binding domain-containing protein [Amoebophilaceae bacterium]|nr:Arm DNA-binding domain-containing protein [Amoebophilaceae bacterium]
MISISENYLKKWRANSAQKILYCGNNLCLCRYGEQLIWRYKIRRKLNLKTLQTWRTIGIYPVINLKQAIEQATSITTMLNDGFNPKTYTNVKQHLNKTFNAVWQLFYLDHVIDLKPNSIKKWNKMKV